MAYTGINKSSEHFETLIYSGNASNPRTLSGLDFQPDWVWLKNRTDSNGHTLADSIRGSNVSISSDSTAAEVTNKSDGHLDAFTSNGFTVGAGGDGDARINDDSHTYVAWNWKAGGSASSNSDGNITSSVSVNTTAGFSIVSYTGTGGGKTVGHGLGVAPRVFFMKNRGSADYNWSVWHADLATPTTARLALNTTAAQANNSSYWNDGVPGATILNLGSDAGHNANGNTYIAYCFAEKQGFSKFGSYVGTAGNNATAPFIHTGFKPAWFMVKNSNAASAWEIYDGKRNGFNPQVRQLRANEDAAEGSTDDLVDFHANGFKIRHQSTGINEDGDKFIYMAFAEEPFVSGTGVPGTAR